MRRRRSKEEENPRDCASASFAERCFLVIFLTKPQASNFEHHWPSLFVQSDLKPTSSQAMKVAIIGGGVSGLSTLWSLNEYSPHEPHLYESGPYIGGHTNTVTYTPTPAVAAAAAARQHADDQSTASPAGNLIPTRVDTGFIVFNTVTYPNFLRFVKLIGATILESDMSFSVSRWGGAAAAVSPPKTSPGGSSREAKRGWFEWAGSSPGALFCQGSNLLNPSHWRMVWDVIRFNNQSLETLRQCGEGSGEKDAGSIGDWLDARGYGDSFRRNYLIVGHR